MRVTANGVNSRKGTSLNKPPQPKRGEVWYVNLDPTVGAEIKKQRPVVVINSDAIGKLPIKLVAPITGWDKRFGQTLWHVRIDPAKANGLTKPSAVDTLQLRGVDVQRFISKVGRLSSTQMEEITAAIAAVIEYK
jgi:mRNA interferase MazF